MRIQHNIMAMNAFRNYNSNTSALGRNLEKLSSGYKINRAGDDAAGLAISEKMRAQISGLKQAQSNVKDGISLVKTAEGALQEVQDMMNRMVTLATQSANGTYDNDVDRKNLQKEVEALKSEIDRIADSANFNGTKLLDGSLDSDGPTINAADLTDMKALPMIGHEGGTTPVYHKDAASASKTSFTLDFRNIDNLNYKVADADDETVEVYLSGYEGANVLGDGGNAVRVTLGKGENVTAKGFASAVEKALGDNKATITLGNNTAIEYEVVNNGDGTLTFTMTDTGYKTASDAYDAAAGTAEKYDNTDNWDVFRGNFDVNIFTVDNGTVDTDDVDQAGIAKELMDKKGGAINGTVNVHEGSATKADQLYDASFDFLNYEIKDGAGLQIGDEMYVWATSKETLNRDYGDNVKVVDLTDMDPEKLTRAFNKDGTASGQGNGDTNALTEAFNRLSVAAKDNKMFSVQAQSIGFTLEITERYDYEGDADLTTKEGVDKVLRGFKGIDAAKTSAATGDLTLQIGDTADKYNKIDVSIQDMHVKALGIGDLDISKQEDAQAAIEKIKSAINTVSSTRGDLGAIQNRLEHTTNNLAIMTENIQDAESTIRDVDIADEMTTYTKNNILLQSAQAMLAQANQMPQGVLQLLQ